MLGDGLGSNTAIVTPNGGLSTQQSIPIFQATVSSETALNTSIWNQAVSTYTVAQAGGLITLNSGASLGTTKYAIVQSNSFLPFTGDFPTDIYIQGYNPVALEANATVEIGIGTVGTTTAPTDGALFRWNGVTSFLAVLNTGGTEQTAVIQNVPSITTNHVFRIAVRKTGATFFVDGTIVATIANATAIPFPLANARQPIFARVVSGAVAPAVAPQFNLGNVYVLSKDQNILKDYKTNLSSFGKALFQNPLTTFGQLPNHANSTSPTSATLSNTAAGYTTLGGRYQFAAVGLAATDYALFAYQVPAGYNGYITRCRISLHNEGAVVTTTASVFDWSLGVESTAVSLATADSGDATFGPRRIPLGTQTLLATAAIGAAANDIDVAFDPPIVAHSGRYIHVILQCPVGSATGSEIFRGDVLLNGYWE